MKAGKTESDVRRNDRCSGQRNEKTCGGKDL
jgi:hypothetical protein